MQDHKLSRFFRGGMCNFTKATIACMAMQIAGCSDSPANRAEVYGSVTIDGVAPETGAISFSPVDGRSPTAGGKIVAGKFSVQVPLGTAKVAIRVPKTVGQRRMYDTPDSPTRPINKESLPSKYNNTTELRLEVESGRNEKDFDLTTE